MMPEMGCYISRRLLFIHAVLVYPSEKESLVRRESTSGMPLNSEPAALPAMKGPRWLYSVATMHSGCMTINWLRT